MTEDDARAARAIGNALGVTMADATAALVALGHALRFEMVKDWQKRINVEMCKSIQETQFGLTDRDFVKPEF